MITTLFSRMTFIVVQFWVLILPNLGRTQRCFWQHTSFSHLILNRLILAVWTLCKSNRSYCTIILFTWSTFIGSDITIFLSISVAMCFWIDGDTMGWKWADMALWYAYKIIVLFFDSRRLVTSYWHRIRGNLPFMQRAVYGAERCS